LIYPGATENCNNLDDDCDNQTDEGVQSVFYADADHDGFGDAGSGITACSAPPGNVSNNTDCNDNNASIYPGAIETCNGFDDNCDNQIDEGVKSVFYTDVDGDGFGSGTAIYSCVQAANTATNNDDCNDNNSAIHPNAQEICDVGNLDEGL
jgi:hypothetical protein